MEKNKKRCKWCHSIIDSEKLKEHEENCDLNDGGRQEQNEEEVDNYYYN
jgi:hypothetical protein